MQRTARPPRPGGRPTVINIKAAHLSYKVWQGICRADIFHLMHEYTYAFIVYIIFRQIARAKGKSVRDVATKKPRMAEKHLAGRRSYLPNERQRRRFQTVHLHKETGRIAMTGSPPGFLLPVFNFLNRNNKSEPMTNRQKVRIILFWRIWWDSEPRFAVQCRQIFFFTRRKAFQARPAAGLKGSVPQSAHSTIKGRLKSRPFIVGGA